MLTAKKVNTGALPVQAKTVVGKRGDDAIGMHVFLAAGRSTFPSILRV